MLEGTARISKEFGVEMRYLTYKSHQFDVNAESRRAVAAAVAAAEADIAFYLFPRDRHADHDTASALSEIALRGAPSVLDKPVKLPRFVYQYDNGPRHTIGFEPDTYVDISADWSRAAEWLGRFMALVRNEPYDPRKADSSVELKESIASYRGKTCGVRYAEAVRSFNPYPREIL
jgi:LmbE family N-acetylglucosaminyl deacetylase